MIKYESYGKMMKRKRVSLHILHFLSSADLDETGIKDTSGLPHPVLLTLDLSKVGVEGDKP